MDDFWLQIVVHLAAFLAWLLLRSAVISPAPKRASLPWHPPILERVCPRCASGREGQPTAGVCPVCGLDITDDQIVLSGSNASPPLASGWIDSLYMFFVGITVASAVTRPAPLDEVALTLWISLLVWVIVRQLAHAPGKQAPLPALLRRPPPRPAVVLAEQGVGLDLIGGWRWVAWRDVAALKYETHGYSELTLILRPLPGSRPDEHSIFVRLDEPLRRRVQAYANARITAASPA